MMVIDLRGFFFLLLGWMIRYVEIVPVSFFFALRLPGRGTRERGKEGCIIGYVL